jgi:CRP-like cAMP-binding protein
LLPDRNEEKCMGGEKKGSSGPGAETGVTPALLKSHVRFLRNLSDGETGMILPCFHMKEITIGETVFSEGDEADFVAFVVSGGYLVTKKVGHRGRQVILANVRKGGILGEFSMVSGAGRSATAICIESGRLLCADRGRLNEFMDSHPSTGCKILKDMILAGSERQERTTEKLLSGSSPLM